MKRTSEASFLAAPREWAHSLPVRIFLVLSIGIGIGSDQHSVLEGLGAGVAMIVALLIGTRVGERRRMRRETRAHNARLSQY
jgi:uncharacterized membrane protein